MSKIQDQLKKLGSENPPSNWRDKVQYRKENKDWLKKSGRIALKVLDILEEKGWSQAKLARELDVTPQQVTKIVRGTGDFKLSTISKLEKVLNTQLLVVLRSDEEIVKIKEVEEAVESKHNYSTVKQSTVLQVSYRKAKETKNETGFEPYDPDDELLEM